MPLAEFAVPYIHISRLGALLRRDFVESGLEYDRRWMVVDKDGVMVTMRKLPRMALIQPSLPASELDVRELRESLYVRAQHH